MVWQKVDYDFKYHNLEYFTDIPVLVMSEGRSLLTPDIQVQCFIIQLISYLSTYVLCSLTNE